MCDGGVNISRKQKKKIIILLAAAVFLGIAGSVILWTKLQEHRQQEQIAQEQIVREQQNAQEAQMHQREDEEADKEKQEVRLQGFSYIQAYMPLMAGEYVDVRISFPNGEDYVVLSKKCVEAPMTDVLVLEVSEDEILMLESARADMNQYRDCHIYAVKYIRENQQNAVRNYPVNPQVLRLGLWNPNIQSNADSQNPLDVYAKYRNDLETGMEGYRIK